MTKPPRPQLKNPFVSPNLFYKTTNQKTRNKEKFMEESTEAKDYNKLTKPI